MAVSPEAAGDPGTFRARRDYHSALLDLLFSMTPTPTPLDTSMAFRHRVRYVVAVVTITVVGLAVFWMTRQALLLVFTGIAIGALLYYASASLSERLGGARGLWLGGLVVVMLGSIAGVTAVAAPRLAEQARQLIENAPDIVSAIESRLGLPPDALSVPDALSGLTGQAFGLFSSAAGVFTGIIVVVIVAVYTAASPDRYINGLARFVDHEHQAFVRRVLHRMGRTLLGWTRGVGIAVVLLTTFGMVGLSIIGLPGALALAAFAGALTAIPTFGPLVGWAPAVAVGFATSTTMGLWTLGFAIVAQQIEGNFITPKVQGRMVSVPPAVIISAQIVLGALAGFLGILLAVPIAGVMLVLVQELYIGPFVEGEPPEPEASGEG